MMIRRKKPSSSEPVAQRDVSPPNVIPATTSPVVTLGPAPLTPAALEQLRADVGVPWLADEVLRLRPNPTLNPSAWRAWLRTYVTCAAECYYARSSASSRFCANHARLERAA